ncbi:uncharacterized protein [Typha angustifolia]|uniref:uncharacterized protein n=1 Tax=Typha angustifolia TaxID=59011 RepID=UPI003C2BB99E
MRKKHRFRKMLSSIIGVDIHHPDNSKVLDSKKDIEQNVQKILKIIGEESNMDNSVNSFDKSELTFLVTDFHKSYQELHEHYYQLIEKLHRGDEGGPSDSSSSGSSDSDSDNKKKSRKVKEDKAQVIPLQDYQNLQEQVECAERKNRQLQCEIESTCSKLAELENLAAKLRERDSVIGTLENKLLMMGGSIEALQSENGVLKQKAEALLKEETDMKERIAIFNEENEALRLENRETSDKLSQAEKCVKELSLLKDHMSDEMLRLKLENTNLKEEVEERDVIVASMKQKLNDTIKEKEALKLATEESSSKTALLLSEVENLELLLKAADKKGDDLTQRLTTIEEENRSLQSEILRLSSNIKEAGSTINNLTADSELLKYEKSELLNSNNDLNEQVKAKEDEVHALASQLEKAQMAKDEVEMLSAEIQTRKNECSRLLANCVDLNLTLESRDAEVSNLKQIIEATQGENKSLTEESLQLASKVQQVELERDGLKGENEQLMVDISLLESKINNLDVELKAVSYQMNELNKELGAVAEEKDRLISENSRFMSELEQADVSVKELEKELEQLKNENSVLQLNKIKLQEAEKLINDCKAEIEQLRNGKALSQTKLDDARFELEVANCQITDLNKEVAVLREGNNTAATELQLALAHEQKLESELEQLREEVSMLQQTNAGLRNKNSDMEKRLEMMGVEVLTLQQKLEEVQRESDSKIQAMTICADDLQKELDLLSIQKSKVEEERNILSDRCLGNLVLMKNLEEEIKSKIVYQETRLANLRGSFNELKNLQSEILRLSSKIKEAESTINNLTTDSALLKDENSELLNSNNDLNEQVKAKEDEVHALASQLEKAQMAEDEVKMLSAEIQTRMNECSRLLADCVDLNLTLESRDAEVSNLKQIIEATEGENKSLTEENILLASKVQQVELERDGLKGKNEQLIVDISLLESEINKMNELNKELGAMAEEKDRLISENSRFMSELEQADVSVKELEKELEQLKNENSVLQLNKVKLQEAEKLINDCKAEIEQLRNGKALSQTKLDDARFELEVANCQITDLNKEVAVLREGNNTAATELQLALAHEQKLESELEQLREEVSMLQQTNAGLRNENSDMEKRLEVMGVEVLTLQQKLEEIQRESDSKIQAMTICADDLQKELDLLSIQKSKVEEERNIISDRCLGNLVLMKNLEEEIKSKIVYQETRLSDLRGSFNEFLSNFKQFKHKFAILENLSIDQNKDMMKLANSCKELEENLVLSEDEKMNALKEIARMHGQVQTLEVQVRLSNQKVKITETESRDKEEKYEKLVEVSQKRAQELEEKMQKLYGELGSLQAQLMQMKEDAKLGTSALGNRIRELESIFSQKSTHFIGRLVECSGILKILEEMAKNQLYEKEELKNEKHELAVRLEKKEGAISSLKDEASYRGAKLAEKERDLEKLMRTVFESEKKIEELEKRVKEKEEELVAKNEEKREAIRQLCLLIEYHRENCTNLLRHVSPTIRSRSS